MWLSTGSVDWIVVLESISPRRGVWDNRSQNQNSENLGQTHWFYTRADSLCGRRYNQSHRQAAQMEDSDWMQPQQHALLNAPALAVE